LENQSLMLFSFLGWVLTAPFAGSTCLRRPSRPSSRKTWRFCRYGAALGWIVLGGY
jgi:hypothetical protein